MWVTLKSVSHSKKVICQHSMSPSLSVATDFTLLSHLAQETSDFDIYQHVPNIFVY